MFWLFPVDLYPLLDTGLSAGIGYCHTSQLGLSPHLRLPLRTSPAWTCLLLDPTFNFLKKSYPFGTKGSIKIWYDTCSYISIATLLIRFKKKSFCVRHCKHHAIAHFRPCDLKPLWKLGWSHRSRRLNILRLDVDGPVLEKPTTTNMTICFSLFITAVFLLFPAFPWKHYSSKIRVLAGET